MAEPTDEEFFVGFDVERAGIDTDVVNKVFETRFNLRSVALFVEELGVAVVEVVVDVSENVNVVVCSAGAKSVLIVTSLVVDSLIVDSLKAKTSVAKSLVVDSSVANLLVVDSPISKSLVINSLVVDSLKAKTPVANSSALIMSVVDKEGEVVI